ncbi:hypothetical protein [Mycoplasma todarodis]|uniref:Uncharacterized protein n=1 Tax=Mycoplasma todarodis TaxID=1937191 RepID=A0A4R0XU91_9MOLU|nr:hypothetical protein [Mycoplasma todarodis]TCG12108.1 hypothetical protein C4B25_00235 [Mycoplasma todarodis]
MFKEDFTLRTLDTHPQKTFSPMRMILRNDILYKEVLNFYDNPGKNKRNELIIKTIFSWNEIFPFGFHTFSEIDINKTFSFLDTFQVVLSFIVSGMEECREKEILEDIRIAMQEFVVFSINKAHYSSLASYRKVIEGTLWIKHLLKRTFPKEGKINSKKNISEQLDEFPNMKEYYKVSSKLIHSKKKYFFNFTPTTKQDDLNNFYKLIKNCFDELSTIYNSIFDIDWINENQVLNRFSKIYNRLLKFNGTQDLNNYKIVLKNNSEDFNHGLALYHSLNKNKNSVFELLLIKDTYHDSLNNHIKKIPSLFLNRINDNEPNSFIKSLEILASFKELSSLGNEMNLLESMKFLTKYRETGSEAMKHFLDMKIRQEQNIKLFKTELKELKKIASELFMLERNDPFSRITITRLLVEEVIFNIIISKSNNIFAFNMLVENMRRKDNSIQDFSIIPHRHVVFSNRPFQSTVEGKSTGNSKTDFKNLATLIKNLKVYLKRFK